jgi:trimethylamine--corrinoid protein Co-methyltransferase
MFGLGSQSDSKVIDEQAAIEMTLHTLMSALAGINMIDGLAQLESCILGSIEMVVLSDEVIEIIKRLINGVDTGSDKEIRELINKVGPGGQYVSQEHTLKNFRSAWFPTLFDRNNFSRWREEGSLDLKQRLNIKTRAIIDNFQMEDLSKETMGGIDQIMAQYNNFSNGKR